MLLNTFDNSLYEYSSSGSEVYTFQVPPFLCAIKHKLAHSSFEIELEYEEELSSTSFDAI